SFFLLPHFSLADLHSFPTRRSSDLRRLRIHNAMRDAAARRNLVRAPARCGVRDGTSSHAAAADARTGWTIVRHSHRTRSVVSRLDRKSTRLNSSHQIISYAVFCLKK